MASTTQAANADIESNWCAQSNAHLVYNSLPSVKEATDRFDQYKDQVFETLAPIFAKYPNYGVCLVHIHFTVDPIHSMVNRVSEPEDGKSTVWRMMQEMPTNGVVPDKWLSMRGPAQSAVVPYEFTVSSDTILPPPPELWDEFHNALTTLSTPHSIPHLPIGICWAGNPLNEGDVYYETTEKSSVHVTVIEKKSNVPDKSYKTGWRWKKIKKELSEESNSVSSSSSEKTQSQHVAMNSLAFTKQENDFTVERSVTTRCSHIGD